VADCTTQQQIICILIILLAYSEKELCRIVAPKKSLRPAEAVVSTHEQNNAYIIGILKINYSRNKILEYAYYAMHSMEVPSHSMEVPSSDEQNFEFVSIICIRGKGSHGYRLF